MLCLSRQEIDAKQKLVEEANRKEEQVWHCRQKQVIIIRRRGMLGTPTSKLAQEEDACRYVNSWYEAKETISKRKLEIEDLVSRLGHSVSCNLEPGS